MAVPPASNRVSSRRPLAPNVMSVTSDKGNNEMNPGAVHRSPGICPTAEENPGKPQLGEPCAIQGQDLATDCWPHFQIFADRSRRSCSQFRSDI
jgi:hypothetical protein